VILFMSPWAIGFLVFIVYPMVSSLYFSFTHYDLLSTPRWIGLDNYKFMFTKDAFFWLSVKNTVWIVVVGVSVRIVFAIATATLLTKPRRGIKTYRTMYFLPSMAPPVAASLAFVYLLNPAFGPVNQLLRHAGMEDPPLWFFSPSTSKWGLVILGLWGVGDAMIIFLAGLLDVPRQLYEAADIEGANAWQKFRKVTLPMISPVIFFSLVTGIIWGFQYFTQAYITATTNAASKTSLGYPEGSLLFYSVYLYQQGFQYFKMGYASALAWVLFIVTMVCTLVLIRTSRRWVHYQGGGMFR
jgi:multiple sugar transport system permease protein